MQKEKANLSVLIFAGALFSGFHRVLLSLQTEVLIFLNHLEFLSATHLFRQFQVTNMIKCINQCTKQE